MTRTYPTGCVACCLCMVWTLAPPSPARSEVEPPVAAPLTPPVTDAETLLLPLDRDLPRSARSLVADEDAHQLLALALSGKARLLALRGHDAEALRSYQRARFWAPESDVLLDEIVPLAFRLDRQSEAVRYAILANERKVRDLELARQLALVLVQEGQSQRAVQLLGSCLAAAESQEDASVRRALHWDRIRLAWLASDFAAAAESFDALQAGPGHESATGTSDSTPHLPTDDPQSFLRLMGDVYFRVGRLDDAAAAYQQLDRYSDHDPRRPFWEARLEAARRNFSAAETALERYLASGDDRAGLEPWQLLWDMELAQGRSPEEVLGRLQERREVLPRRPFLELFLADQFVGLERPADAQALLEPLWSDDPSDEALQLLATVYLQRRLWGPLIALLGRVVESEGDLELCGPAVLQQLGEPQVMGAWLPEAERRLRDERRPMLPGEAHAVALLALQHGQLDRVSPFVQFALAQAPDHESRQVLRGQWAVACIQADAASLAIEPLLELLAESPDTPGDDEADEETEDERETWWELLATARHLNGETEQALELLQRWEQDQGPSLALMTRRAWILAAAGRPSDAISAFESVLAAYDGDQSSELVRETLREARLTLASLFADLSQRDHAEQRLLELLDEFPDDAHALNDLGYLWADQQKNLTRARQLIERALEFEPHNAAYLDSLGWVLYQSGKLSEALPVLENAVAQQVSPDGVILDHLADVYSALGRADEARQRWLEALKTLQSDDQQLSAAEAERMRSIMAKLAGEIPVLPGGENSEQ